MINEKVFVVFVSLGVLQTLSLPAAKCYTFHWDKDNFGRTLNSSQSHFFFFSAMAYSNICLAVFGIINIRRLISSHFDLV